MRDEVEKQPQHRGGLLVVLSRNYLVRLRKITLVTGSIGVGKSKERENWRKMK